MNNNIINTTYATTSIAIADTTATVARINTEKITNHVFDKTKTEAFDKLLEIPFSIEEYKIVILLKNGGNINKLTFDQLVRLCKLYSFSDADLIALKDNLKFIKYLNDTKIKPFNCLPYILQNDITIAKMAFLSGDYRFIKNISPENQTIEIYNKFINYCSENKLCYVYLGALAEKFQTKELWHKAFISNSHYFCKCLFSFMPDKFKTQDFCDKVCGYSIDGFQFVPKKFKSFSLCASYVLNAKNLDISLIPKWFHNELQNILITRIKNFNTCIKYKRLDNILGLEYLSKDILKNNPDIIIKSCISSKEAMYKLNSKYISSHVLQEIAITTIENIAEKYMNIDLVLIRLKNCNDLDKIEEYIVNSYFSEHKDKIQQLALHRVLYDYNMFFLKYIPDYLTEEKCYQYINEDPSNYKRLPDKYKFNIDIIIRILKISPRYINSLKSNLLTKESYQTIFAKYPKAPNWQLNLKLHRAYILKKCLLFDSIAESDRSLDIWLYLCNNKNRSYINKIPEQLFTKEVLYYLVDEYVKWNNIIDISFIENLFHQKFFDTAIENKILQHSLQCIARSSDVLFAIIKSVEISQYFKNILLYKIKIGIFGFTPAMTCELYSKVNPMRQAVSAKFASDLLVSCYNNSNSKLCKSLPKITQRLKQYIIAPTITQLPLEICTNGIFTNAKLTGGRTAQVNISPEKAIFYKFRKYKEDLADFLKEGYFYEFLNYDIYGKSLKARLKSSVPELQKMVRIQKERLPKNIFACEDSIDQYVDSNNVECVDVLVFIAPIDYLKYAHELESSNTENPFNKAETGMLKACHDIGLFTSIGIYHTSTLPAYHLETQERKWSALHMLLRQLTKDSCRGELACPISNDISMVGKLENWDTKAINRPDYGYTGLRDFGDFEFFGEIKSALKYEDSEGVKNFPNVIQNILAANTICECLLAVVLLYARIHKPSPEYHYKNEDYKKNIANFIEQIFTNFLLGRLQITNIDLAKFMQLSADDYYKWLDRTVTEILYWTASKHDFKKNTTDPNIDFNDHVLEHLKNGKLPEELYDDHDMTVNQIFENFYNEHNLGLRNATFPLLSLMNFMFLFNIRIHEYTLCK